MLRRSARWATATLLLVLSTAGCEMNVKMRATFDAAGGGSLNLSVALDRELVDALSDAPGSGSGLAEIEALFARLEAEGWAASRSEGAGGLSFSASKQFSRPEGMQDALGDLERGRGSSAGVLPLPDVSLRYDGSQSLLRSRARIEALIDAGMPERLEAELEPIVGSVRDELAEVLSYEIVLDAPGAARVTEGTASVEDGAVVWRPQIGARERLVVATTATRRGGVTGVAGIAVLLVAGAVLAWPRRRVTVDLVVEPLPLDDEEETREGAETTLERTFRRAATRAIVLDAPIVLDEEPRTRAEAGAGAEAP